MTSNIPQNSETLISQNKVIPISEKTEQPQHHHHQQDLMTPPMSPINTSLSSNQPGTARSSLKITAGQTGLPWLTRDAGGDNNQQTTTSPEALTDPTQHPDQGLRSPSSPPPKFLAQPRTGSIIRVPTRKRTMQKHIYSMRDGLDPVKVLCNRLKNWQVSVKYLVSTLTILNLISINICVSPARFRLVCFKILKRLNLIQERAIEKSMQNLLSQPRLKVNLNHLMA